MNIIKSARMVLLLIFGIGFFACSIALAQRTATAVAGVSNGEVVKITITDGGRGYDFAPKVTFKGGGGVGAKAEVLRVYFSGSVGRIEIQSRGSGYTDAPQIEIEPPDPVRAIALEKAAQERSQKEAQETALKEAERMKEEAQQQRAEKDLAEQTAQSIKAIARVVGRAVGLVCLAIGIVVAARWAKKSKSLPNFANVDLGIVKYFVFAGIAVIILGFSVYLYKDLQRENAKMATSDAGSAIPLDPNPTGTWTAGNPNSVYNRLTVTSYGTFSFETVDFTGDVKGGYSGTWSMNGNSIRFEWGRGGADSGSCSGRKTGRNSLVFGSTTFSR